MNKFNDWPIRRKLMIAFCLSAVLTALLGGLGFSRMKQMQQETDLINQDVVPVLSRLSELRGFAGEFRVYEVGQFVNLEDPERYAMFFKRMDEIQAKYVETQKVLDTKIGAASPLKAEYAKLTDASARYFAANQQLRKLYADPDRAAAMEFSRKQSGEIRKELFASVDKMYAQQSKALGDMVTASAASFKFTSAVLLLGTLLIKEDGTVVPVSKEFEGYEGTQWVRKRALLRQRCSFVWHLSESFGIALAFSGAMLLHGLRFGEEDRKEEVTLEVKENSLHEYRSHYTD